MTYKQKQRVHALTHGGNVVRWSATVRPHSTVFHCEYCGRHSIVQKRNLKTAKYPVRSLL